MAELKVTARRGSRFYLRAAATFLRGTQDKPPVDILTVSGAGNAVATAAEVVSLVERRGLAKVVRVQTSSTLLGSDGHKQEVPRLEAVLRRTWCHPDPNSYSNIDEVVVESYALQLEIDFGRGVLEGHIDLAVRALGPAERVVLDTRGLSVAGAWELGEGGPGAELPRALGLCGRSEALGEALELRLARPLVEGERARLRVAYATAPDAMAVQVLAPEQTLGKRHPYLFTQCQAIHARSLMPCQDTPGVKSTYDAEVVAPAELTVLMSAVPQAGPTELEGGRRRFAFKQPVAIPSYLLAIACGHLESRKVGPRSHVWSEPEAVEACAHEFAETEAFMQVGERLFGDYVWGIYDLLVLPPSFPYGGMENPCLTFVTPTLIAGDRSLADVVAHEITHSWFGNLCTNKNWECFWLNEGFTKFGECRIMRKMHDSRDYEQLLLRNNYIDLAEAVELFGAGHDFTRLCPDLAGQDPDDAFSTVPYVKGQLLLLHLEGLVGEDRFEAYLKEHVRRFSGGCLTETDFRDFFLKHFEGEAALAAVDWDKWFYGCGMPDMPPISSSLAEKVDLLCSSLMGGYDGASEDIQGWFTAQTLLLLDQLIERAREAVVGGGAAELQARLPRWNDAFAFDSTKNSEIRFRWLILALVCGNEDRVPAAIEMAKEVGRMKFTRPLWRELLKEKSRLDAVKAAFEEARGSYHPITAKMVAQDIAKAEA